MQEDDGRFLVRLDAARVLEEFRVGVLLQADIIQPAEDLDALGRGGSPLEESVEDVAVDDVLLLGGELVFLLCAAECADGDLDFHHDRPAVAELDQGLFPGRGVGGETGNAQVVFPATGVGAPVAAFDHGAVAGGTGAGHVEVGEEGDEEVSEGMVHFAQSLGFGGGIGGGLEEEHFVNFTGAFKMDGPVIVLRIHHLQN